MKVRHTQIKATGTPSGTTYLRGDGTWSALPSTLLTDPTTTKGDLIVRGSSAPPSRLAVGTDGWVLTADSAQSLGVKWAAPASSGHTIQEEGTPLAARTGLNFIGAAVTAADDSANNRTNVTITANVTSVASKTGVVTLVAGDIGAGTFPSGTFNFPGTLQQAGSQVYTAANPPPYPVTSVATRTGAVTLTAADIGAGTYPAGAHVFQGAVTIQGDQINDVLLSDTHAAQATPKKYIRSHSGQLQVLNDAGTTVIMSLTDAGVLNALSQVQENGTRVYSPGNAPPYPVTSVATRTGAVTLTLADIAAGTSPAGTFNFNGTLQEAGNRVYSAGNTNLGGAGGALSFGGTGAGGAGTQYAPNTHTHTVPSVFYQTVQNNGTGQTQRNALNLIPGTNISFTFADDSGNNRTNLTINGPATPTIYYQTVKKAGVASTQRANLNFIDGTGITITLTDNSGTGATDVTIAATGGGGAVTSVAGRTGAVTLTAADIGAGTYPAGTFNYPGTLQEGGNRVYSAGNPPPYPVTSVASRTGAVTLTAADVAAGTFPAGTFAFAPQTGTSKGRVTTLPGVADWFGVTLNANFNGTGWDLDDTAKVGWFFKMDSRAIATEFAVYRIPSGANPHTDEAALMKLTSAGNFSVPAGTITEGVSRVYSAANPPPYPVTSVAGRTGAVTLTAADLGAGTYPAVTHTYPASGTLAFTMTSGNPGAFYQSGTTMYARGGSSGFKVRSNADSDLLDVTTGSVLARVDLNTLGNLYENSVRVYSASNANLGGAGGALSFGGTGAGGGGTSYSPSTHTHTVPTAFYQLVGDDGTSQTARNRLNLISGTGITVTAADNSGTNSTDVTIAATGGGGAVTSVAGRTGAVTLTAADIAAGTFPAGNFIFAGTNTQVIQGGLQLSAVNSATSYATYSSSYALTLGATTSPATATNVVVVPYIFRQQGTYWTGAASATWETSIKSTVTSGSGLTKMLLTADNVTASGTLVEAGNRVYSAGNPPPYPVDSVAGKTGAVTLVESDIANLTTDLAAKLTATDSGEVAGPTSGAGPVSLNGFTVATGWTAVTEVTRKVGPVVWLHLVVQRNGATLTGGASGNIADTQVCSLIPSGVRPARTTNFVFEVGGVTFGTGTIEPSGVVQIKTLHATGTIPSGTNITVDAVYMV